MHRVLPLWLVTACHPAAPAEPAAPEASPAAEATPNCPETLSPEEAQARFEAGETKLAESKDGEHYLAGPYEEAMALLTEAAEAGHLGAMSLYGNRMFGDMFTYQAPQPDERANYVRALKYLRLAALAGDETAASFIPALAGSEIAAEKPQLADLPEGWLEEVKREVIAWPGCHPRP